MESFKGGIVGAGEEECGMRNRGKGMKGTSRWNEVKGAVEQNREHIGIG